MATNLNVTLPLLELRERIIFEQYLPEEIFPGGMREMVVCLLENQESADYFVRACFDRAEYSAESLGEERQDHYETLLRQPVWLSKVRTLLYVFFDVYTAYLQTLFAGSAYSLVRVLSYETAFGVCVELAAD